MKSGLPQGGPGQDEPVPLPERRVTLGRSRSTAQKAGTSIPSAQAMRRIDERYAERELKQLVEDARSLAHRVRDLKREVGERPRLRLVAAAQTIEEAIWELKRAGKLLP